MQFDDRAAQRGVGARIDRRGERFGFVERTA